MSGWRWPRRAWVRARAYPRTAPGTLIYLFTLLITQLTLGTVDDRLGQRLLLSESTNLHNMARVPLQVLIGSAFWFDTDTTMSTVTFVVLLLVLAPVERWLGTGRWLLTVVAGHVGATLITLMATAYVVRHGLLAATAAHATDVGVSYVVLAALGVFTYRLPRSSYRVAWALVAAGGLGAGLWSTHGVPDLGHLSAFLIGLACYPVATFRRRGLSEPAAPRQEPLGPASLRTAGPSEELPCPRTPKSARRVEPAVGDASDAEGAIR
jgi:hypothetical protein